MLDVITLFSGYDSQCLALNRLGLPYDLAAWCEIDRHAITAHNALFPQWKDRNLGDVSRVDWAEWHRQHPQPIDLLTYSSPCQDFSSAGLQRGGEEGSGTRSGLLWEVEKAIAELRPRSLVFENVAALVSEKFITLFNRWQARLNGYGYTNFQQLMNAKDYGVPQNRLRIFMVSILDCQRAYYFPKPFRLEKRLKDVLEQNVDERYYLSDESVERLFSANKEMFDKGNGIAFKPSMPPHDDIATSLMVTHGWRRDDNFVAEPCIYNRPHGYFGGDINNEYSPAIAATEARVHKWVIEPTIASMKSRDKDNPTGIRTKSNGNFEQRLEPGPDNTSNTITSVSKDNMLIEPAILKQTRTEEMKEERRQKGDNGGIAFGHHYERREDGITNALSTVAKDNMLIEPTQKIRIRRLTERDLFRLMDVDEADIDILLSAGIAKTQLAKMAGNSIVVACLEGIFRNLLIDTEPQAGMQTKLF